MSIPEQIRAARQRAGWSQQHLAEIAGISISVVSKAERGGNIKVSTLEAVAKVLKIEINLTAARRGRKR